jgi:hypothetical protein
MEQLNHLLFVLYRLGVILHNGEQDAWLIQLKKQGKTHQLIYPS